MSEVVIIVDSEKLAKEIVKGIGIMAKKELKRLRKLNLSLPHKPN